MLPNNQSSDDTDIDGSSDVFKPGATTIRKAYVSLQRTIVICQ